METTLSVCHACGGLNNVRRDKALAGRPTCGKCGAELKMHSLVSEVNGRDLERIIAKADAPVIVDFWASWCGPCRMYGPEFERASVENANAIFLKINTEENQELSAQLGIRSIPTTVVFKHGREFKRQSGALPRDAIRSMIN